MAKKQKRKKGRITKSAGRFGVRYGRRIRKNTALMNGHGITLDELERMYENQKGICLICGKEIKGKNCHVDHNHETGKIRGLLCSNCNTGLGLFQDKSRLLIVAAKYVINDGE